MTESSLDRRQNSLGCAVDTPEGDIFHGSTTRDGPSKSMNHESTVIRPQNHPATSICSSLSIDSRMPTCVTYSVITTSDMLETLKKLIEEEFRCPICLDLCDDTKISPDCGHRFCDKCIKESLQRCNNECPTCRVHIATYRTCRSDPQFDRIVSIFWNCFRYIRLLIIT